MQITVPTLLLDERKCRANIARMAEKARRSGVVFRPHFKTHQSHEVGRWVREEGVDRITTSSLRMAEYFAEDGWSDIAVAFPANILEAERINRLAGRIRLHLLAESVEAIEALGSLLEHPAGFYIKVDSGTRRTGVAPDDTDLVDRVLAAATRIPSLSFTGFLTHAGHAYLARGKSQVAEVAGKAAALMAEITARYRAEYPEALASIGDTPGCSVLEEFPGVDEIRPGNFVFYDVSQYEIGACSLDDVAVALVCPVVALHPERNEAVIYGGAVHFSKDRSARPDGTPYYGLVADFGNDGWTASGGGAYLHSISQEHGVIRGDLEYIESLAVGDLVAVLPIHSCLAADLMKSYTTLDGDRIDCFRLFDFEPCDD